jgi:hypothetical protein
LLSPGKANAIFHFSVGMIEPEFQPRNQNAWLAALR